MSGGAKPESLPPDPDLPPPPERPDCCFGGCAQCVLDDYAEAMQLWQQQVDAIVEARRRQADQASPGGKPA